MSRRRLLGAALAVSALGLALATGMMTAALARTQAGAAPDIDRLPEILGFRLGMALDAAIRRAQTMAPSGSVTLPPQRRELFVVMAIEAPAALAPPVVEPEVDPKDSNFYMMLNSAPRILKTQPARSSHVGFIRLVADQQERRLLRVVFEPSLVYWSGGLDAATQSPAQLVDTLRKRFSVEAQLVAEPRPGRQASRDRKAAGGTGSAGAAPSLPWALRVHVDRKSVVLTDLKRLPDEAATRLRLD